MAIQGRTGRFRVEGPIGSTGQGPRAAVFVIILMTLLLIPMFYYLRSTARSLETR